jgi:hypothetical protein
MLGKGWEVFDSDPVRSRGGTRFLLFPQPRFLEHYSAPMTVRVSSPAGTVGPGPADDDMYAVVPIGKQRPYGIATGPYGTPYLYLPAWRGPIWPPALPDRRGHFDHLSVDTPEFEAAHAFGCVRWVLDIWKRYLGRPIAWNFKPDYDALEISLFPEFDNAYSGYGFLEIGADTEDGKVQSFALNHDVIAHETGHLIIYSLLGVPDPESQTPEYLGFHESAADLVAMMSAAHFEPVLDELFANTRGNLYALNELNRIGELSQQKQIRLASNLVRMSAFREAWEEHRLSLPLTGAIFDILCDIYHRRLIERGLIGSGLQQLVSQNERLSENDAEIQAAFDAVYAVDPPAFRWSFYEAREWLGRYLASAWQRLSAGNFSYETVRDNLLEVDRELGNGRYQEAIESSFRWREIGEVPVGPVHLESQYRNHLRSSRTVVPAHGRQLPPMSYRERWAIARGE